MTAFTHPHDNPGTPPGNLAGSPAPSAVAHAGTPPGVSAAAPVSGPTIHADIHPSAIVDAGAELGEHTRVWHFAHVCAGARIGAACSLGQNVFVANDVLIGNGVKVQNNVSIYDAVTLEDDVFCGPSMVFTNVYNPRSAVPRKHEYRRTLVRRGATVGANATVVCGVTIGEFAFVAAGAVVNRDVAPYALVAGVPARQIGWISRTGDRLALPLGGNGEARCPHTGEVYVLRDGVCAPAAPHPGAWDGPAASPDGTGKHRDGAAAAGGTTKAAKEPGVPAPGSSPVHAANSTVASTADTSAATSAANSATTAAATMPTTAQQASSQPRTRAPFEDTPWNSST